MFGTSCWNGIQKSQMRLGCFGIAMEVKRALKSGKRYTKKKNLIANLHHVDMIVEMRVIEEKTKWTQTFGIT